MFPSIPIACDGSLRRALQTHGSGLVTDGSRAAAGGRRCRAVGKRDSSPLLETAWSAFGPESKLFRALARTRKLAVIDKHRASRVSDRAATNPPAQAAWASKMPYCLP